MNLVYFCLTITAVIASILMYIKVWKACDNIEKISIRVNPISMKKTTSKDKHTQELINDKYDVRLDNVKIGDKVLREYDKKEMVVKGISEKGIECYAGFIDGINTYPKSSLEYIKN